MNIRGKVQVSPLGDTVDVSVFVPLPHTQQPPQAREAACTCSFLLVRFFAASALPISS